MILFIICAFLSSAIVFEVLLFRPTTTQKIIIKNKNYNKKEQQDSLVK